ncbi:metallophosphoesterase family protein [Psychrobacillus psychrodurans]|uniref:Metallophosphoesterase n=1 Tax=Psychrobacillus psychrodurans TaxID=126157 RepID=A0A9X3LBW2_9BACI|nr:metallophosphoesterase [Psychrobacillus psychrodurans]MCZ8533364.1 metallophosphoesterase [Psychrobacillus psychrodurans]
MHILHISDIHAQINNYQTRRMRNKIIEKISQISENNPYDYILLSGDITHQGGAFSEIHVDFIKKILSATNLSNNNLIILPGNHDLVRNPFRTDLIKKIYNSQDISPSDYLDEILNQTSEKEKLLSSFEDFLNFYFDIKQESYSTEDIHSLLELETFSLISINTCLIANEAGEEGKMLIGKSKLLDCLDKLPSKKTKPIIAVGHHTLDCLEPQEKQSVLSLFDDYNVDLYLSGHVHQAGYHYEANNYNKLLTIVCSGVHFDNFTIGGFVDIDINTSQFHITQYQWNSQQEYWTKNNSLGRKMSEGTLIHDFELVFDFQTKDTLLKDELKATLTILLNENERIFKQYGPKSIIAHDKPYSELAYVWKEKVHSIILPNNDKIVNFLDENINIIPLKNKPIFDNYKNHVDGFKNNQIGEFKSQDIPLFPKEIYNIFD